MTLPASPRPQTDDATLIDSLAPLAQMPDWLRAIVQPERVRTALARSVPQVVSGELLLRSCEIRRVRIKKDRWTGIYELTTQRAGQEHPQSVLLQGALLPPNSPAPAPPTDAAAFGAESWRWYLPELRLALATQPADSALPALAHLADPATARALLERAIRAAAPRYRDLQIQQAAPTVVRDKPGSRCTIRYQLQYPADRAARHAWPAAVFVKTYKDDKGRGVYAGMRRLWESPLARGDVVTIAEPLAFLPELNALVQSPIPYEQTLKDLIRSALRAGTPAALDELTAAMAATARGLAALHQSQAYHGDTTRWEDELADVRADAAQLAAAIPQLEGAAAPLLSRLEALAASHPADPLAPAHRSFRPGQVLLHGGSVGFIDFDRFGQAEPALDIALFLSSARNIGLSEPHEEESSEDDAVLDPAERQALLAQLDAVCEAFLAEYERHAPVSRQRVVLWETLDLLALVLNCWTKIKPVRLANTLAMLERHLRTHAL